MSDITPLREHLEFLEEEIARLKKQVREMEECVFLTIDHELSDEEKRYGEEKLQLFCDCVGHCKSVVAEFDPSMIESNDGITFSMYDRWSGKMGWREIWRFFRHIRKYGTPYTDMVSLSRHDSLRLLLFIHRQLKRKT